MNARLLQRYLLPGLVFQGIVIGGGYATGREIVEFFLPHGLVGGLLGMAATALLWSAVMAVSFELCRMTRSFDHRHFFRVLLGRGWVTYEVLLIILMMLVLAVVGAASGEIVHGLSGFPVAVGTVTLIIAVGALATTGTSRIERLMGGWSILLYLAYGVLVVWSVSALRPAMGSSAGVSAGGYGWIYDGIRYAGYNVAIVPMVFFCLRHLTTRNEAVAAGLLAGVIGIVPAVLLFVALQGVRDQIIHAPIPSAVLLEALGASWFELAFQIALLGTLIQTGVGMVHGINERIANTLSDHGRSLPRAWRAAIAMALGLTAVLLSEGVGIVRLIAKGYGFLTFGFLIVFVIPVLTVGVWKVCRKAALS